MIDQKFWDKVEVGDCWVWTGAADPLYGVVQRNKVLMKAHRYAYEMLVGPIPDDKTIDHLCKVKRCVNPDHLEPVTPAINSRRALRRPHCKRGHRMKGQNVLVNSFDDKQRCRACNRMSQRRYNRGTRRVRRSRGME